MPIAGERQPQLLRRAAWLAMAGLAALRWPARRPRSERDPARPPGRHRPRPQSRRRPDALAAPPPARRQPAPACHPESLQRLAAATLIVGLPDTRSPNDPLAVSAPALGVGGILLDERQRPERRSGAHAGGRDPGAPRTHRCSSPPTRKADASRRSPR